MLRVLPGLVRLPDVSFLTAKQVAEYLEKRDAIGPFAPALAVEVISRKNTRKEMQRKRKEYFLGGTQLVWIVDPVKRTVEVWTSPDQCVTLTVEQTLTGGDLLPGFSVPVRDILPDPPKPTRRNKPKRRGAR